MLVRYLLLLEIACLKTRACEVISSCFGLQLQLVSNQLGALHNNTYSMCGSRQQRLFDVSLLVLVCVLIICKSSLFEHVGMFLFAAFNIPCFALCLRHGEIVNFMCFRVFVLEGCIFAFAIVKTEFIRLTMCLALSHTLLIDSLFDTI